MWGRHSEGWEGWDEKMYTGLYIDILLSRMTYLIGETKNRTQTGRGYKNRNEIYHSLINSVTYF